MGGAEHDRGREVGAHAHREIGQPVTRRDLSGQREMRRRRLVERRNAHQPRYLKAVAVAAACDEGVGFGWRYAGLLRLLAGIELDEQLRKALLAADLFRQR